LSEFNEISIRLEEKSQEWEEEIEDKNNDIIKKKENLNSERILLTKEMIDEIEEEISFEMIELRNYQKKRFGPDGDYILQKKQLIQPIQDQIFNAIKEIAKNKGYDFIFDKSADIVMLYSDKRHDISDQIIRIISRANNRRKLDNKKDIREAENENLISEIIIDEKENKGDTQENNSNINTKRLSVKELLEKRKQKNSINREIKD
jgi:Skp family chaperone for outer membrane proteins